MTAGQNARSARLFVGKDRVARSKMFDQLPIFCFDLAATRANACDTPPQ
ncbi:MAG: hypothetical protein QGF59_24455 [Pirellulaceae bacterium]|jgi:hypothetical protein|nr:hypothetical protein [Pirellulaceae bacterium]